MASHYFFMEDYLKIEIPVNSIEASEILMAALSSINFYAFEEEQNLLVAYINKKDFNEQEFKTILTEKNLYKIINIEKINWNEKWESEFEPVIVNNFAGVRAAFHQPIKNIKHEIIITPKMSFGTAHHPTTYLMLEQMERLDFENKTVLDFGTGTGILAILAKKLGAKKVTALDNDEWSITNAAENFLANDVQGIELKKQEDLTGLDRYDIILSNINLNIIVANSYAFKKISKNTQMLLSGFLKKDEQAIVNAFIAEGFAFKRVKQSKDWICVLLTITEV